MQQATLGSLADRVLLIDKVPGCTSHDVVLRVRRQLGEKRIGHAGTLDPFATGLLLLLVGRGTKLFPLLSSLDKEYEGVMRLGVETSSGDPMGEVVSEADASGVTSDRIAAVARSFVGPRTQVPPMTSAVKVNGQPLYKLSRRGIDVERKARNVCIEAFDVLDVRGADVSFRTRCSKGTYIRSLALEFGRALGVGAHLISLNRTRIGSFSVRDAFPADRLLEIEPRRLLSRHGRALSDALENVTPIRLNPSGVRKVRCGIYPTPADMLDFGGVTGASGEFVQLQDPAGELVAVGRSSDRSQDPLPATRIELVRVI